MQSTFVAELDGVITGYAGMWTALDEGEITNVSVKASGWGNGMGRQLVETLLDAGKKAGGFLLLSGSASEQREGNFPVPLLWI
mgnify:CR=1 FL=1